MWTIKETVIEPDQVFQYHLYQEEHLLKTQEVIQLWINDASFRTFYTNILTNNPFEAFFWEHPPIDTSYLHQSYEFVLVKSNALATLHQAQRGAFREHFKANQLVVCFDNLRKDASLIVPTPLAADQVYIHLAAFVRQAPKEQLDAFWKVLGQQYLANISMDKKWLSTSGLGVHWLHVRIDARPKYYTFRDYRLT